MGMISKKIPQIMMVQYLFVKQGLSKQLQFFFMFLEKFNSSVVILVNNFPNRLIDLLAGGIGIFFIETVAVFRILRVAE